MCAVDLACSHIVHMAISLLSPEPMVSSLSELVHISPAGSARGVPVRALVQDEVLSVVVPMPKGWARFSSHVCRTTTTGAFALDLDGPQETGHPRDDRYPTVPDLDTTTDLQSLFDLVAGRREIDELEKVRTSIPLPPTTGWSLIAALPDGYITGKIADLHSRARKAQAATMSAQGPARSVGGRGQAPDPVVESAIEDAMSFPIAMLVDQSGQRFALPSHAVLSASILGMDSSPATAYANGQWFCLLSGGAEVLLKTVAGTWAWSPEHMPLAS